MWARARKASTRRLTPPKSPPHNPGTLRPDPVRAREQQVQRLLERFGESLLGALAESPAVHRSLARLRRHGCTVRLLVDCVPAGVEEAAARPDGPPPEFRIDAADLAFLRAIGIDPTRRVRRRAPR